MTLKEILRSLKAGDTIAIESADGAYVLDITKDYMFTGALYTPIATKSALDAVRYKKHYVSDSAADFLSKCGLAHLDWQIYQSRAALKSEIEELRRKTS